jgi:hypothetical protein
MPGRGRSRSWNSFSCSIPRLCPWPRRPTSSAICVTPRASGGRPIGYTWEAEHDWGKATDAFRAVARDIGPKDFLFDEVQFALARVQELAGKPAEAIATYERLLKDVPNGVRVEEAKQHLMRLGAKSDK